MSNIISEAGSILSSDVHVFPCTRRAANGIDIKARQLSEENVVNILNSLTDSDSFVITDDSNDNLNTSTTFEFVIGGYYVKIASPSGDTTAVAQLIVKSLSQVTVGTTVVYAYIKLEKASSTYMYTELAGIDDESNYYSGIIITDNSTLTGYDYKLPILKVVSAPSTSEYYGLQVPIDSYIRLKQQSLDFDIDGGEITQ